MIIQKYIHIVMLLAALSGWSCKTRTVISKEQVENRQQTDSVSLFIQQTTRPITVPQSTARMIVQPDSLIQLPVGANFRTKAGNATATIINTKKGFEVIANCDSLIFLITDLHTEVFHLNKENTKLTTSLNEQKTIEINQLSGWQWFQVWTGRILGSGFILFVLFLSWKQFYKRPLS